MATALTPPVKGFLGENRLLPPDLNAPNMAEDGQNVDYQSGTIKKRLGIVKTHGDAYVGGAMKFENSANNRALVILDQTYLDLTGEFTIECLVRIESDPSGWSASTKIITKRSGTDGWILQYVPASTVWDFRKCSSAPSLVSRTVPGDLTTGTHPVVGETYHLAAWRTSGNNIQLQVTRLSDGTTSTSATTACSGDTNNTRNVYVGAGEGATPANQTGSFSVDEIRIWGDQRTSTELDDCRYRELTESERTDTELIGYWRMNDNSTTLTEDLSVNNNPALLSSATCAYVPSIMPNAGSNNFALQGNGIDAYATAPYSANYATILNTGDDWEVNFWAQLNTAIEWPNNAVLCQLGSTTTNNGHVFSVYIVWPGSGAAPLLKYSYSTTTTQNNTEVTPSTAFNPEPGVPFHVRLGRVGTSLGFIVNGTLIDSETSAAENGPTVSTSYGMTFLARNSAGTYSLLAPCTIDEVRLFTTSNYGNVYMNVEFPNTSDSQLVGYWRFNANDPLNDEKGYSDAVLVPATEDKPSRTYGMAYPAEPEGNIKLIGPVATPVNTTNTNQGQPLFRREFLIATKQSFFTQQGTVRNWLKDLDTPGSDSLYSAVRYLGSLICCNGVGRNYIYNGTTVPSSVTLPSDTDVPTATPTGAGGGWIPADGSYTYRFTWYNQNLDIEGPYWGQVAATMTTALHDTCNIASVPTSVSGYPGVTHWRLYRLDPSATVYRLRTTVAIGTATFNDDGTSVATGEALHTSRDHLDPQNVCEVFGNRLFFARGSALVFSDADTLDFSTTSILFVDRDDGESITGLKSHFGQLIVFKKTSIHVLDGDGPTTYQLRKVLSGVGCVSPHTVASSPQGVYFLGHDGAYIFNGSSAVYISHSQQPLFRRLDHEKAYLAVATYHPETHQYIVSFDAFTEATLDPSKPSQEAYDSGEFQSLFTHYYRCVTGADAVGTGGTINDAEVTFVSDSERGTIAYSQLTDEWSVAITAQTAVTSDWTFGFWRRIPDIAEVSAAGNIINLGLRFYIHTYFEGTITPANAVMTFGNTSDPAGQVMTTLFPITKWVHVVVRKSGTVYTIFLDGLPTTVLNGSDPVAVYSTMGGQVPGFQVGVSTYLDNIFWIRNTALTSEQINGIYMFEVAGGVTEGITMVYDEETQSWAKHDKRFEYLTVSEQSSRSAESVGALNGFVARLNESNGDLVRSDADTAFSYTRTGSLSAATGLKITDATATFPTSGDGYAGCRFVAIPTDTTLETQRRTILYNTATVLYLDLPLSASFTGTYYIGPIELVWESPMMDVGSPAMMKTFQYLNLWQRKITGGTYTVKYKTDVDDTYQSVSVTTSDLYRRFEIQNAGRRLKLRVECISASSPFEIHSFQIQYNEQELVA